MLLVGPRQRSRGLQHRGAGQHREPLREGFLSRTRVRPSQAPTAISRWVMEPLRTVLESVLPTLLTMLLPIMLLSRLPWARSTQRAPLLPAHYMTEVLPRPLPPSEDPMDNIFVLQEGEGKVWTGTLGTDAGFHSRTVTAKPTRNAKYFVIESWGSVPISTKFVVNSN